jgi:hypothetical protein
LTSNSAIVPVADVPSDNTSPPPSTRPDAEFGLLAVCPFPTPDKPHHPMVRMTTPHASFAARKSLLLLSVSGLWDMSVIREGLPPTRVTEAVDVRKLS